MAAGRAFWPLSVGSLGLSARRAENNAHGSPAPSSRQDDDREKLSVSQRVRSELTRARTRRQRRRRILLFPLIITRRVVLYCTHTRPGEYTVF